jgi:hypothetical protein
MRQHNQTGGGRIGPAEQAMRDEEVVRANRELAAYFKGRRTEREARAALKIIKAFVRDREHLDPKARPPLPGLAPAAEDAVRARRPKRRKTKEKKVRDKKKGELRHSDDAGHPDMNGAVVGVDA